MDRVGSRITQVGAVARVHFARGRAFVPEPRVEAGVIRERVTMHGVSDSHTLPYLRAGIDWRLGTRRAGAQLAIGYVFTGRLSGEQLDLAVGGLDVAVGPYYRF